MQKQTSSLLATRLKGDLSEYRKSAYNVFRRLAPDRWILFNTLTGAAAEVVKEDVARVKALLDNPSDVPKDNEHDQQLISTSKRAGFLVPTELDELQLLKTRSMIGRFNSEELALTIMPTLDCNFRCLYCYERRRAEYMSDHTESLLLDWIEHRIRTCKWLRIDWFGGEPLLAFDRLRHISQRVIAVCESSHVEFLASLTTNGYMLTDEYIKSLSDLRIRKVQVTLDGPPELHDRMRPHQDGTGTFSVLIANIERLLTLQPSIQLILRVNCSAESLADASDLLRQLPGTVLAAATIYAAEIYGCDPDGALCERNASVGIGKARTTARKALRKRILDFNIAASRRQGRADSIAAVISYLLQPKAGYCNAVYANRFVVDPTGRLFKCTVRIEPEDAVGKLVDAGEVEFDAPEYSRWLARDAFDIPKCRSCTVLPLCLGGCRNSVHNENSGECATPVSSGLLVHALRQYYSCGKDA